MNDLYMFVSHNVWDCDISKSKSIIPTHPYYTNHVELIGKKMVYTREDIEKYSTFLCTTKYNRLLKLKSGNFIKVFGTGANSKLYVYRLTPVEASILEIFDENSKKINLLQIEIETICKKQLLEIKKYTKEQNKLRKQTKIKI